MTIHWKAVEQYFAVVLFVVKVGSVCDFGLRSIIRQTSNYKPEIPGTGRANLIIGFHARYNKGRFQN